MRALRVLSAPVLATALAACGAAPFEYHPATEIPRGPGLFSGEGGALVLRLDTPGEREEFQRQKSAGERSPEYREFQEWREWREWKRRQGN